MIIITIILLLLKTNVVKFKQYKEKKTHSTIKIHNLRKTYANIKKKIDIIFAFNRYIKTFLTLCSLELIAYLIVIAIVIIEKKTFFNILENLREYAEEELVKKYNEEKKKFSVKHTPFTKLIFENDAKVLNFESLKEEININSQFNEHFINTIFPKQLTNDFYTIEDDQDDNLQFVEKKYINIITFLYTNFPNSTIILSIYILLNIIYIILDKEIFLDFFVSIKNNQYKKAMETNIQKIIKNIRKQYVGQKEAEKIIELIINNILNANYVQIVLQGDSGIGKTFLSELIAKNLNIPYTIINGSDYSSLTDANTLRFFDTLYQDDIIGILCIDEFEKMDVYYQKIFIKLLETRNINIEHNKQFINIRLRNKFCIFTTNTACELETKLDKFNELKKVLGKPTISRITSNNIFYLEDINIKNLNLEEIKMLFKEKLNSIMKINNIEEINLDQSILNFPYQKDLGLRTWQEEILQLIISKISNFRNEQSINISYCNDEIIIK